MGLPASGRLAAANDECNVFGLICGRGRKRDNPHPGLIVIDYDGRDQNVLGDLLARHGLWGVVGRTASGKFHIYYTNNGERRKIRIRGKGPDDPAVDLCGAGGYVVAPPSEIGGSCYELVQGTFEDLASGLLPVAKGLAADCYENAHLAGRATIIATPKEGSRNETIFQAALQFLAKVPDRSAMSQFVDALNESATDKLSERELDGVKGMAWKYQAEGRNGFAAPYLQTPQQIYDRISSHPKRRLLLDVLFYLKRWSGPRAAFVLANGMAAAIGCKEEAIAKARKALAELGAIILVREWTRSSPAVYRWPETPPELAFTALTEIDCAR